MAQCTDPSISLPDENQPVANPSVSYCVDIPINPAITGDPIGFSMELEHTFIGDLSIRVNACGETFMLVTRPGGGSCNAGAPFGSSASVNGYFTFSEGGGPNPDNGLAFGGGDYGLSNDPCNVNTVNSFAELAAACGGGPYTLELCITDHANVDVGFAGSISPIFPGIPPTVCGCTDPLATNYDPSANFDNGTCVYPPGCGDFFYDSGGPGGPYQNQEDIITTICPDIPGDLVEVTFSVFDLESNFDDLTIYNGPNTSSPAIGSYSGNNNPGTITSSHPSGCLTFVFDSDFSGTDVGWAAFVDCVQPCVPPAPPVATPAIICQGESASLSAAPCTGGTIRWYTGPSGGSPIASGPVYTTPVLNTTTTYYVACDIGDCASDRAAVTVQVTAPVTPALAPIGPFCQGAPPELLSNVQDGVLGTWSGPGVNAGFFTPSFAGPVALTFTPAPGECANPAILAVEVIPNPVPDIDGPDAICDGNTEFLTVTANFASYLWNTNETTQTIPVFGSGTYSVTVTAQPGNCIGEASFTVNESPAPMPSVSGDTQICPGESTTLSVDASFESYEWSDGSTGPSITVNEPGSVDVTVTDATGCEGIATVNVEQIDLPDPQLSGPVTLCPDIPGTLSIVNAGAYESFSWSTTDNTGQVTIPGPGTYTVTVTNKGCETEASFTVAEDAALPPSISGALDFCDEASTFLSVSPTYESYSWSTGGNGQAEEISSGGNVGLTVTDANGCIAETNVDVVQNALPNVQLTGDEEICTGGFGVISVVNGASYTDVIWNNTETDATISVSSPGTYSVTATDINGCVGTANFDVAEVALPGAAISGVTSFCTGTSAVLTADPPGMSYDWSDGTTMQSATIDTPGEVFLTVTNASGCQSVTSVDVTEVTELSPEISGPTGFCTGEVLFLTGPVGFSAYEWSDNSNSQNVELEVTAGGTYSLTVTDATGCTGSDSVVVTENPLPDATITGELAFCEGDSTVLSGASGLDDYTWSDNTSGLVLEVSAPGTYSLTVTDNNECENSSSVDVIENTLPEPEIDGNLTFCADTTSILSLTDSYQDYEWSDGSSAPVLNIDESGAVAVTVTDVNGCSNFAAVDVVENPLPVFSITGEEAFCENETVTLGADSDFESYQWSTGATTNTAEVSVPGLVALTVTDTNGCSSSNSITLVENELPATSITGTTSFCANESTTLTAPDDLSTYLWENGDTTQSTLITAAGTYGLTVTDINGCTATTAVDITEDALPQPEIQGINAFCPDSTVTLSLNQPFQSYQWSTGGVGASIEVSTADIITVEVMNEAGCVGFDTLETQVFPAPQVNIIGENAFCAGDTLSLSAEGTFAVYNWSTGAESAEIAVNTPGNFGLTVTDTNGCSSSNSITLVENELPATSITGTTSFCANESTTLTAPDDLSTYLWENGDTTQSTLITAAGTYGLTVTDINGCTATTAVDITEDALPQPEIQGINAFCPDSTVTLSLNQPFQSYQWSTGGVGASIEVSTADIITVEVMNEAGCVGFDTLETQVFPAPQVNIIGENAFCAGDTLSLSAEGTFAVYNWSTGAADETISISSPGNYSLTVTDTNGCPADASTTIVENALPEPEITGQDFFCAGDSAALDATNGFESYLWSDGTTAADLVVATQGTSAVTVTDANGCQGTASFFVDEINLPTPQINGVPAYCPGTSTTLSASAIFSTYQWSTGDTTGTAMVSVPGDVALTVTNAQGCAGTTSVEASEYTTQVPQIEGQPNFCPGTSTALTAEAGFESYLWSTNAATPEVEVTSPGTIEVMVTDSNECVTSNSIEVGIYTVQSPDIEGPEGFCTDTIATLSAGAGYTAYEWSTGSDTESITLDSGGIYRVTVTDVNGCLTQANYQLLEYNLPSVAIGGSASFCPGGFATLNAGGEYAAYEWSTGSGAPSIEVDQEDVYALTVTDANGCTNSTTLQVTQEEELSPVISGPLQFCPGTQTQLSAGSGYTAYEWQDGADTAGITVATPGTYSVYVEDASGCSGTASVEVDLFPEAEVDISAPEGFCVDESAMLTAGGASLSAFEWEDGSFDPVRTVTEAGTYTVIATDINGCLDTASYEITTYPLPEFEIEGTPFFCAGESTILQASEAYPAYDWNSDTGESEFEVNTPGLYVLEAVDSNGCQNQASLEVSRIPLPVADAGIPDTLTCTVNAVTIGGNGTSMGPAFVYEWTGPGINGQTAIVPSPTVSTAGDYELIVTDTVHGCVSEPGLTEVPLSNDVPIVSLSVDDTLDCATNSLVIDGSASSSWPALTYQWEDMSGTVLATNTNQLSTEQPGLYVLLLEDAETGCAERDTVQVIQDTEIPMAEAGLTQRLDCAITSVPLSVAGSTQGGNIQYTWLDESGLTLASEDTVIVSSPGTYTLRVTNTQNSCQSEDEVTITQDIEAPVAVAGQPQQIDCLSPTANLNGTGSQTGPGISHQWAFGAQENVIASDLSITVDTAGTYFLIVTNEDNQCLSIATVQVSEVATAPTALETAANGPTCFGDGNGSILISSVEGGTSPYLFSINGGAFDQQSSFTNLDGGIYDLIVQDAIGCEYETEIVLEEGNDLGVQIIGQDEDGQIKVGLGEEVELFAQANIPEEEINRYLWQGADSLSCYDCQVTYVTPSASGLYQVQVTDLNGCTATDQIQVILNKKRRVYLPNVFSPNGDGANDIFYVQAGPEVVKIQAFEVYSRWGEPVFTVFNAPPDNPQFGWNGQYRGELMNGAVFTWFATVEYVDGVVELFQGDVLLMR